MPFNPRSLRNLRRIIDKTGGVNNTKVVISSSWRLSNRTMIVLKARLMEYGIRIGKGYTTPVKGMKRGEEIYEWLKDHEAVITTIYADNKNIQHHDIPKELNFVILDDEVNDIVTHFNNLHIVKVNWKRGLTYWKAKEAIHKINNFMRN